MSDSVREIPRAAIEAGARALQLQWEMEGVNDPLTDQDQPEPWNSLDEADREYWRARSREVLAAALPVIVFSDEAAMRAAKELEEGFTGLPAAAFPDDPIHTEALGHARAILEAALGGAMACETCGADSRWTTRAGVRLCDDCFGNATQ